MKHITTTKNENDRQCFVFSGISSVQISDLPCSLHTRKRVVAGHASDGREEAHCELVTPWPWATFTIRRHVENSLTDEKDWQMVDG